jgi:hypothetical protein
MMRWDAIIVPTGYTDPITANGQPIPDEVKEAIKYQARRLVLFAEKPAR